MSKFKPGPAKTNSGLDVIIYEVSDKIYGKCFYNDGSAAIHWDLNGDREFDEKNSGSSLFNPDRPLYKNQFTIYCSHSKQAKVIDEHFVFTCHKSYGIYKITIEV